MHPNARESDIQRVLLARLNAIPGVYVDRVNVLVASAPGRFIRSARNGTSDILGCARGLYLAVETKARRGVQSDDQREFEAIVRRCGGIYILARDVDQVLAEVRARIPVWPEDRR